MESINAKELLKGYIETKAEKYRMLEIKNKCIDNKMNTGEYLEDIEKIKEASRYLEECNKKHLEHEYNLNNLVRTSNLYGLNKLLLLLKSYTQNKIKDIRDNLVYLNPTYDKTYEQYEVKRKMNYFEKYEKPSIKDLVFIIQKAKALKFGMTDEESTMFAYNFTEEIEKEDIMNISNSDIIKTKIRDFK